MNSYLVEYFKLGLRKRYSFTRTIILAAAEGSGSLSPWLLSLHGQSFEGQMQSSRNLGKVRVVEARRIEATTS